MGGSRGAGVIWEAEPEACLGRGSGWKDGERWTGPVDAEAVVFRLR